MVCDGHSAAMSALLRKFMVRTRAILVKYDLHSGDSGEYGIRVFAVGLMSTPSFARRAGPGQIAVL